MRVTPGTHRVGEKTGTASPRGRFDSATHRERDTSPPVRDQHAAPRVATLSLRLTEEVWCQWRARRRNQRAVTMRLPGTAVFLEPASPPGRDIRLPRLL